MVFRAVTKRSLDPPEANCGMENKHSKGIEGEIELLRHSELYQFPRKGKRAHTLMLVDNLDLFFRILCQFARQPVSLSIFKKKMEEDLGHVIYVKTAHTYFYTATTYKMLIPASGDTGRGFYVLSETGRYLCSIRKKPERQAEYRQALESLLLMNPAKGRFFSRFLRFVKEPVTEQDVYKKFGEPTGKTLIAWTKEAGLVRRGRGLVVLAGRQPRKKPTINEFWDELLTTYKRLQMTPVAGARRFFVPISDLRDRVSLGLGLDKPGEFNQYLHEVLASERESSIGLYGAPPHILEELRKSKGTFKYRGKNYVYISVGI